MCKKVGSWLGSVFFSADAKKSTDWVGKELQDIAKFSTDMVWGSHRKVLCMGTSPLLHKYQNFCKFAFALIGAVN